MKQYQRPDWQYLALAREDVLSGSGNVVATPLNITKGGTGDIDSVDEVTF